MWNAKGQQHLNEQTFVRKYLPIGTYASMDQTYSQFKNHELSAFLFNVPSQILRNSAANWYFTMQGFLEGHNGRARIKKYKTGKRSAHLTNELFKFTYYDYAGDVTERMTIIDKVNKLIKYNLIDSESLWRAFRKARNQVMSQNF